MRTEVLEVKRACFCFPLRYSLLLCGYGRLIFDVLVLEKGLQTDIKSWKGVTILGNIIYFEVFVLTLFLLDFIFVGIFIIGAHKKDCKLIKIFYFYDLGLLILQTIVFTAVVIWLYVMHIQYGLNLVSTSSWKISLTSYLTTYLIFKGYVLLLVKSEIIKLSNTCQFSFVNNAAESECTMKCMITGDGELDLEKSNEEVFESQDNSPQIMFKLTNEQEGNIYEI